MIYRISSEAKFKIWLGIIFFIGLSSHIFFHYSTTISHITATVLVLGGLICSTALFDGQPMQVDNYGVRDERKFLISLSLNELKWVEVVSVHATFLEILGYWVTIEIKRNDRILKMQIPVSQYPAEMVNDILSRIPTGVEVDLGERFQEYYNI